MSDVHTLVMEILGCKFVYPSTNPNELRCLLETPENESSWVQEWLIRLLPAGNKQHTKEEDATASTRNHLHEGDSDSTRHHIHGLENKLDGILRLQKKPRGRRVSPRNDNVRAASDVLGILFTHIPRYNAARQPRAEILHGLVHTHATPVLTMAAFGTLRGILETADGRELVVYDYEHQSLQDLLQFNRFLLDDDDAPDASLSDMKRRFLVYQLFQTISLLHAYNLSCSNGLRPSQVFIHGDCQLVQLGTIPHPFNMDEKESKKIPGDQDKLVLPRSVEQLTPSSPTQRWCRGDVSNYEYLMMLNAAAGRRMIDSVFHPILPWVTDFSSRESGWRDLTKSKFRLQKGDHQLDRTYESSAIAHHIPESLSEITYYIYMARRTPMDMLRHVVRRNFQAKEYPSTMAAMFLWTPDECIPAFYSDASVFTSIYGHETMPDLTLPTWCHDAEDFIRCHRGMLESPQVSSALHKWIDLNFGVCLSGEDAIRCKNVPLKAQRTGSSSEQKSSGFVQLFQTKHPPRRVASALDLEQPQSPPQRVGKTNGYTTVTDKAADPLAMRAAVRIADGAMHGFVRGLTATEDGAPAVQRRSSLSPSGNSDPHRKGLSTSFVKLTTKKTKISRPKSQGMIDSPLLDLSPSRGKVAGSARSPTAARFAHAIPKLFGSESTTTHGSIHTSATVTTTTTATGLHLPAGSSSGCGGATTADGLTTTTTATAFSMAAAGESSPVGQSNNATHLFRDLWHQLSKSDEDESSTTNEMTTEGSSSNSSSHGNSGYDGMEWNGSFDFDTLDETSLLLLRAAPRIQIPSPRHPEAEPEAEGLSQMSLVVDIDHHRVQSCAIDAAYSLPSHYHPECYWALSKSDRAICDDVFALGCLAAEIYTGSALFSTVSLHEYCKSYSSSGQKEGEGNSGTRVSSHHTWRDHYTVQEQLRSVPLNIKNMILGMIHPDPMRRIAAWQSHSSSAFGSSSLVANHRLSFDPHSFAVDESVLFPAHFHLVLRFLADCDQQKGWSDRFQAVQKHLPMVLQLPDDLFRMCLPVLLRVFKPRSSSHTHGGEGIIHGCAAVVFLLPVLAGKMRSVPSAPTQELLDDTLAVYESSDVTPFIKLCLATPNVLNTLKQVFGSLSFLRHFVPILIEWLASLHTTAYQGKPQKKNDTKPPQQLLQSASPSPFSASAALPLFSSEAKSMLTIACGEVASSEMLGAAVTIKYFLPSLLPQLGKISSKWSRLANARLVTRQAAASGNPSSAGRALGGKYGDGIHVAYAPKHILYEPHSIADAILLVCRELPPASIGESVLPYLVEAIPRLVDVAESVSSASLEGVPDDLAREVYVSLRVLRHVVRSLSDQAVRRELLQKRASVLIELLNRIQPPFLHPCTVDAVLTTMSETIQPSRTSSNYESSPSLLARHHSAPPLVGSTITTATATETSQRISDRLEMLRGGDKISQLRAFTAVGVARTITGIFQKVGVDGTTSASAAGVVQSVNAFLTRCAAIYSPLQAADFQWQMASEVVAEFCSPLRALLGATVFAKLFPIVEASSVLQALLRPNEAPSAGPQEAHTSNSGSAAFSQLPKPASAAAPHGASRKPAKTEDHAMLPELLHAAYRSSRLHGIKTTSFLHVSMRSMPHQDLNEEIYLLQEDRKKRRLTSTLNRSSGESSSWLRTRVTTPFLSRSESKESKESSRSKNEIQGGVSKPIGSSWLLRGEVRHSVRAHSSAIRCISVDLNHELVFTGSKNGSCRTWRLGTFPSTAVGAVSTKSLSNLLAVKSLEDGQRAMALTSNSVLVWDIRTSQVVVKVPFSDDKLNACALLRVAPFRGYQDFAMGLSSGPVTAYDASGVQGPADVAVSSSRSVFLLDTRVSPRVVADWQVDAHGTTWITTSALITIPSNPIGLIALGTASGQVTLLDKRMGRCVTHWQALENSGRVVKIVQYTPSYVLVIGSEREACVWILDKGGHPTLAMIVTNIPEGTRDAQVSVQAYADASVLHIASSAKVYCARLLHASSAASSTNYPESVVTVRMESWSLMDTMSSSTGRDEENLGATQPDRPSRSHRTKISAQSIAALPLSQVVLLGGEDGSLRTCV